MKVQNLAIIFLVITIPLILILSYYLNLQRNTLKLQAEYDLKLSEATKEGIKAYEINTVDWATLEETTERRQVDAMINGFITSLANKLNISGTAKEYMLNYIPAMAITMYDGYYIYAPSNVPMNWEYKGNQLFLTQNNEVTTDKKTDGLENATLYIAKFGCGTQRRYEKYDDNGVLIESNIPQVVTTNINEAEREYKYILNSKIAYTDMATGNSQLNVIINYTLDNRIYLYGTQQINGITEYIEKDGYLVCFGSHTQLPKITISRESISRIDQGIVNIIFENNAGNKTVIEPETLEEQIVYYDKDVSTHHLGNFKYVYDINQKKLYYDEEKEEFFKLATDNKRVYLGGKSDTNIKVGSSDCFYKSVSVLLGPENNPTEYKKIYQVLNGQDMGKWYINLKEDPANLKEEDKNLTEEIDTELTEEQIILLGLNYKNDDYGVDYSAIYKDFSAINYYVEAYAFTNWVNSNNIYLKKVEENGIEILPREDLEVSSNNNPEDTESRIVERKREVIKNNINKNLNLAISNYGQGIAEQFQLPVLTYSDWEQVFSNISLITFFQGVPIGLKSYNGYSLATSTTNRAYVDPGELYFRADGDEEVHRVYCKETKNITYTGYRGVEYVLREFTNFDADHPTIYYYEHDKYTNPTDQNAERSCYYCKVNKSNYTKIQNGDENSQERTYKQAKSYNEALARERYFQKEKLRGMFTYMDQGILIKTKKRTEQTTVLSNNIDMVVVLDYENTTMPHHNWYQDSDGYIQGIEDAAMMTGINLTFVSTSTGNIGIDYETYSPDYTGFEQPSYYVNAFNTALTVLQNSPNTRVLVFLTWEPDEWYLDTGMEYLTENSDKYDILYCTYCCYQHGTYRDWNDIPKYRGLLNHNATHEQAGYDEIYNRFRDLVEDVVNPTITYEDYETFVEQSMELKIVLHNLDTTQPIIIKINGRQYSIENYSNIVYREGNDYIIDFNAFCEQFNILPDVWNNANVELNYSTM